jgi:hypothetical protein
MKVSSKMIDCLRYTLRLERKISISLESPFCVECRGMQEGCRNAPSERYATVPRVYPTLVSGVLNLDDRTENAGGY